MKGQAALIVACVAVGIGANTAFFSVVNGLLLRAVPVRDPGRLVRLRWTGPNDLITRHGEYGRRVVGAAGRTENAAFSYPVYRQLAAGNQTMTDLVACAPLGRVNVVI